MIIYIDNSSKKYDTVLIQKFAFWEKNYTLLIFYSRIILALLNQFKSHLIVTLKNNYHIQILKLESKIIDKIAAR